MKKTVSLIICIVMISALISCANAPRRQRSAATGAAVGAGVGALLGQALGRDTESTLIGAGIDEQRISPGIAVPVVREYLCSDKAHAVGGVDVILPERYAMPEKKIVFQHIVFYNQ